MKDVYFLFSDGKEINSREAASLIEHFCLEHGLSVAVPAADGQSSMLIEETQYDISVEPYRETSGETYWMICCKRREQNGQLRRTDAKRRVRHRTAHERKEQRYEKAYF